MQSPIRPSKSVFNFCNEDGVDEVKGNHEYDKGVNLPNLYGVDFELQLMAPEKMQCRVHEAPAKLSSPMIEGRKRLRSPSLDCQNLHTHTVLNFIQYDPALVESCPHLVTLISGAEEGLRKNILPSIANDSMGGTYFLKDSCNNAVIVCKPGDEEPNSPNNPRPSGKQWESYKGKIIPGFGMYREVAAYIIDRKFAGVPETTLAKIRHPFLYKANHALNGICDYKVCSLQQYVFNLSSSIDYGSSNFSCEDVQKIAALDIRICNLDRHGGNILVSKSSYTQDDNICQSFHLIPIDHGYCLPHINYLSDLQFEWRLWRQSNQPIMESIKDYVRQIDIEKDIRSLQVVLGEAIPTSSILTLRFCTYFLKAGVEAGLTFREMADAMIGEMDDVDDPSIDIMGTSKLQKFARKAIRSVLLTISPRFSSCQLTDSMIVVANGIDEGRSLINALFTQAKLLVNEILISSTFRRRSATMP